MIQFVVLIIGASDTSLVGYWRAIVVTPPFAVAAMCMQAHAVLCLAVYVCCQIPVVGVACLAYRIHKTIVVCTYMCGHIRQCVHIIPGIAWLMVIGY